MLCSSVYFLLTAPLFVNAFDGVLFQKIPTLQKTTPSKFDGVDIELPDFDELFGRIQKVSPLARFVIQSQRGIDNDNKMKQNHIPCGFEALPMDFETDLSWKTVEHQPRRIVREIQKIDFFQGLPAPLLRFRSSLKGPCSGDAFAQFIMDLDWRKRWDTQIEDVREIYPINDLDHANIAMGFGKKYGDCSRLGIGYCQTKAGFGVSPREQLILCGIQNFSDGSVVIWGSELPEWHNHLFPPGYKRHTRAKSHLFSTTLTPTNKDLSSFDVEYCLQLEIGGNIPTWLTTPLVVDSVKRMFTVIQKYLEDKNELDRFFREKQFLDQRIFAERHALLMTP
jgi:hypothetical protein